ncbi:hypothetical protein K439DRAFT_333969 [Ramaria rubella]|nr:hypothetical protein K439DRAFT_333969 [Ramaria rubella]
MSPMLSDCIYGYRVPCDNVRVHKSHMLPQGNESIHLCVLPADAACSPAHPDHTPLQEWLAGICVHRCAMCKANTEASEKALSSTSPEYLPQTCVILRDSHPPHCLQGSCLLLAVVVSPGCIQTSHPVIRTTFGPSTCLIPFCSIESLDLTETC